MNIKDKHSFIKPHCLYCCPNILKKLRSNSGGFSAHIHCGNFAPKGQLIK